MYSNIEIKEILESKDDKYACLFTDKIILESKDSDCWYSFFDAFASLMEHPKSLVRNRSLTILSSLAKWDTENKFNSIINEYLSHVTDEKPITSRQCIKSLKYIAEAKPELISTILITLNNADVSKYKESMKPLIEKDINEAIKEITILNDKRH